MPIAKSVEDTVLGEAKAGNYQDMLGIVSVIDNRSKQLGVSYNDVVAARGQFDAYGKAMPPGVGKYRGMAQQAIAEVREKGPVHQATFYATPAAAKGLPKGLSLETKTEGHNYYSDPQGRSIATAQGYKSPDKSASLAAGLTNVAGDPSDTLYDVTETTAPSLAAAPAATQGGFLGTAPAAAPTGLPSLAAPTANQSLTGTTAYGFPTYSPTVDIEDRALSAVRGVEDYNPAAQRSLNPTTGVVQATQQAVTRSFGPGYSVGVFSGQEPAGVSPVGSKQNHPHGYAIDFDVVDPMGNPVDVTDPQVAEAMKGVHASLAATGRGIGYGKGYMAEGRTHVGTPPGSSVVGWGRDGTKGTMDPSLYADLSLAKSTGVSLPSFGPSIQDQAVTRGVLGPVGTPMAPMQGPPQAAPVDPSVQEQVTAMTPNIGMPTVGPTFGPEPSISVPSAVRSSAPESIMGPIGMPTVGPTFGPAPGPMSVPTPTAKPTMAPRAPISIPAPISPTQASVPSRQAAMPTMATAADVWGGKATTGMATNGSMLGRNPDGTISMTSGKYGYTDTLSPAGDYRSTTAPGLFGIDAAAASMFGGQKGPQTSIAGPLGQQQSTTQGKGVARGIGDTAKSTLGGLAGGMIGGAMMGPVGGILGGMLGRSLAQGKSPFGRSRATSPAQARSIFARGFTPGLGFPSAPTGASSQGGLTAFGEAASRGEFGGQAQAAADNPGQGLY